MSNDLYLQLQWLPKPPEDWRMRLKQLTDAPNQAEEVRYLASHALSASQLEHLARRLGRTGASERESLGLTPFRLGIVSNGNLDLLVPQLVASAVRHGIWLDCVVGPYGQIHQQALDPAGIINSAQCQAVLLAIDYRDLVPEGQTDDPPAALRIAQQKLSAIRTAFLENAGAPSIVQTLVPPPESLFGNFDRRLSGTRRAQIAAFNQDLLGTMAQTPDYLLDVAAMAEQVGTASWYAPDEWHMAKLSVSLRASPYYADQLGRLLGAILGKSRRCLVLDLDNTIWGGIVGDDGIGGLRLGQGDPVGEAFVAVQQLARDLHGRGVALAISSKNDDTLARTVFREHPDMVLREDHIAVFQANWSDKASNLAAIAGSLSLDLSSLVFLDDNPAERALIRQRLPVVAVPELPSDPALFARTLAAAGYFEAIAFSQEDVARTGFYASNAQRAVLAGKAANLDDYLGSLAMEIRFAPFDAMGQERIAQLIAKSNQFNLTTKRYSGLEVGRLAVDPTVRTIQVRLQDCFGDNGMVSIVILRCATSDRWVIDSWLMSCRVLGRGVEKMVLAEIVRIARAEGASEIVGVYRPTSRNVLVRDHYEGLGFSSLGEDEEGNSRWIRSTAPVLDLPPIKVAQSVEQVEPASLAAQ
ncbi:HAD-IIIC family phosphatase [Sphingobium sp. D43FB]|uniref:HAD-IIIC family phosphatase n=1 Tax=Sphingobium sp. D43FB TaxID=2017595 RepID=UPI000BB56861|nr:HAD-IIIC family phosphatase [Sphingobium sp. D43FB]PBN41943.1 haloacid dehalogenase [Sphingobium sp. D43FB]